MTVIIVDFLTLPLSCSTVCMVTLAVALTWLTYHLALGVARGIMPRVCYLLIKVNETCTHARVVHMALTLPPFSVSIFKPLL